MKPIKVAIVDDSGFLRKALVRVFESIPGMTVVGTAGTAEELLEHIFEWDPDVIILDIFMPGMGGLAALDRIMAEKPTRVIVMSTHSGKDAPITIEALHKGALDFIDKQQYSLVDFGGLRDVLVEKITSVTAGKLRLVAQKREEESAPKPKKEKPAFKGELKKRYDLVLIGASTGGPPAIQQVLDDVGSIPLPILVVQHMPVGFTRPFAERLNNHMPMQVCEASHGLELRESSVYIAPAGQHLHVRREGGMYYAALTTFPDTVAHRPSVDILFHSAVPFAKKVIAVLLTGMGQDGAQGMQDIFKKGAYTIAQDESTSVVYGMPKVAAEMCAAKEILPLYKIGERVKELLS